VGDLLMADVGMYPTGEIDKSQLKRYFAYIGIDFNGIADIEDFKYRLRQDNLLTPELEDFIEYYMRYRNKDFLEELIPDEF
jgi:hypothetical protein